MTNYWSTRAVAGLNCTGPAFLVIGEVESSADLLTPKFSLPLSRMLCFLPCGEIKSASWTIFLAGGTGGKLSRPELVLEELVPPLDSEDADNFLFLTVEEMFTLA